MKAVWILEYDYHSDKSYKCPGCPDCEMPIFQTDKEGNGICPVCVSHLELDEAQKKFVDEAYQTKVEKKPCVGSFDLDKDGKLVHKDCDGMAEIHYRKNPATNEWEAAYGSCPKCGATFIV